MAPNEPATAPVGPSLARFGLTYVVLCLLLVAFYALTGLTANSGASMGALIGAAWFAGFDFHRRHQRLPQAREKSKLVFGSLGLTIVLGIILNVAGAILLVGGFSRFLSDMRSIFATVSPGLLLGLLGLVIGIHLLVLWLTYGPLLRFAIRQQEKRQAKP